MEVAVSEEELWANLIRGVGSSFFVINNMERDSGFLNVSYAGDPQDYVDCGLIVSEIKGPKRQRFVVKAAASRTEYAAAENLVIVEYHRNVNLSGRANVLVESISAERSRLTVNVRYVLSLSGTRRIIGENQIAIPFTDTVAFNTNGTGYLGSNQCKPTEVFEEALLSLAIPGTTSHWLRRPMVPPSGSHLVSYHSISVTVSPSSENADAEEARLVKLLRTELTENLRTIGFAVRDPAEAQLKLQATIAGYSSGNSSLRAVVGFGAGRAALRTNVSIVEALGVQRASFSIKKVFTGMEMEAAQERFFGNIKGNEAALAWAANKTAQTIAGVVMNNGQVPVIPKPRKPGPRRRRR